MTDYICVNIVDTADNNQQCFILYHEDGITLETQRGNIDSNLKTADIYFKRGFTIERLLLHYKAIAPMLLILIML